MHGGDKMSVEEMLKATAGDLQRLLSANNILGDPVEIEDKTLIPVVAYGFGYGGGGGKGEAGKGEGTGSGSGGGVSPRAVIIVYKGVKGPEGVQVLSLKRPSPIAEAISEAMPQILEAVPKIVEAKKKKGSKEQ